MLIVEADRDARLRGGGDDVGGGVADVEIGDFYIARLKPVIAFVQHDGVDGGQDADQARDRIVGQMGIGDMALRARNLYPHIDRAAPADLDDVAQPLGGCRLAHQAQVGAQAMGGHAIHQRQRAVHRRAFLIAGDDQADRAGQIVGQAVQRRDIGGDRALHVHRAAAIEQVPANFRLERVAGPAISGRHHVQMPGEGEMGAGAGGPPRQQIFDRAIGGFAGHEAVDGEAQRFQHRFHRREYFARGRGDGRSGEQPLGEGNGVCLRAGHDHGLGLAKEGGFCQREECHAPD
jgi:hypothetical protein